MSSETLRNMLVKQEPRNVACCFVCAGSRADYPLFSNPRGDRPFFPFLEHHNPPENAENITLDGRVLVCSLCYMLLTQQWESYERNKTPHTKRIYWLKRLDNGPFAGMEMNLQQDYESLFDTSHGPLESDSRQKSKSNRNLQTPTLDIKKNSKFSPRTESRDSNFSNKSDRYDPPESNLSNALDLSLPCRTPSHSSLSAISPTEDLECCYVCGSANMNLFNVYAKPIANCPFFPSLIFHAKPPNAKQMDDSGKVYACLSCHKNLLLEWEHQRQNASHTKRSYNFKLSESVLTSAKQESSLQENVFVCFTCGMTGQTSMKRELTSFPDKQGEPYFSFLTKILAAPGSQPLSNGKAVVCSLCYKSVFRQLRVYELSGVPEERRKYKIQGDSSEEFSVLRQHLKGPEASSKSVNVQQNTFCKAVCYLCDKFTESAMTVSTLNNQNIYFPFIRDIKKSANAEPIDINGMTKTCKECYASLKFQWDAFEHAKIPINQRQYRISSSRSDSGKRNVSSHSPNIESFDAVIPKNGNFLHKNLFRPDICCLCSRHLVQETAQVLETRPQHDKMYFPFIPGYLKAERKFQPDEFGCILACNMCFSLLKNQWDLFESAAVPHSQRQYQFFLPPTGRAPKGEPSDMFYPDSSLHVVVSSPDLKLNSMKTVTNPEPLLTTVNTFVTGNVVSSTAPSNDRVHVLDLKNVPKQSSREDQLITGPLDAPMGRPLLISAICFLCSELSSTTPMFSIHSQSFDNEPFFPFLTKHSIPEGAEKLSPEGSALICIFCYHSLMSQYLAYDMSPYKEDGNQWQRRYNIHHYVCFICGVNTSRRKVCSIAVQDFPFLIDHSRPPCSLTLLGGECVVTCLTCFETLTTQWKDFERLKIPLKHREYSGISCLTANVMPSQESSSAISEGRTDHRSSVEPDDSGLAHGSKPPPHVPVQTIYGSKPSSRAVAASPGGHSSISHAQSSSYSSFENNSTTALSATRTSSFAAALRKLAKQAVDPIADRDQSPMCSPGSGQRPKSHGQMAPYANSHLSVQSGVVAVPPVSSNASYELDKRKVSDYARYVASANSSSGRVPENITYKAEYAKHDDQRNDSPFEAKRSPRYSSLQQYSSREEHNNLSHGFQPYRNNEESPLTSQMYDQSSSSSAGSVYPYHRSLYNPASSSSSQSYRLEEPTYYERYGLLRPPAVSFPSSTNVLPYPGMPFYPNNRYPPGLLAQASNLPPSRNPPTVTERDQREDSYGENEYARSKERRISQEPERSMFSSRERIQRDMDSDPSAEEKSHRIYSPLSLKINTRTESPINEPGRLEAAYNNSHDLLLRKHSPQSSSAPLNLVKHVPPVPSSYQEDIAKWKARQQYAANSQSYNNPGGAVNNGFDSGYEQKYQMPPLISEVQEEMQAQRLKKQEEFKGRSVPNLSRDPSPYSNREYLKQHPDESFLHRSVPNSHVNGALSSEAYDHQNIYRYQEMPNHPSSEEWSKNKVQVRNGTVSIHDSWNSRSGYPSGRLPHQEPSRTANVPSSNVFTSEDAHNVYPAPTKDTSITRALLQNQMTPSAIERYVQSSEEPELTSKLDCRESKLRQLRFRSGDPDCELSDSESDEETSTKLKEFLVITKGPPLQTKVSPQKLGFFKSVGLTTRPKRQYLEWRKYMKRRRVLRERSNSPIIDNREEGAIQYNEDHLAELSKRLCVEDDSETKRIFLNLFGLEKVIDSQVKAEPLDVGTTLENQRENFKGKTEGNMEQEAVQCHFKKRLSFLNQINSNSNNVPSSSSDIQCKLEDKKNNDVTDSKTILSEYHSISFSKIVSKTIAAQIPPLIPSEQAQQNKAVKVSQDPRSKFLDRSFAQEFHESVLQATQMQLGQKKGDVTGSSAEIIMSRSTTPVSESGIRMSEENRRPFSWPGIEAIMESYESHISEQSVEKEFLVERLQYLESHNQEINAQIACLGQKTSELVQTKHHLETKRVNLQAALDNLKQIFEHLR